MAVQSKPYNDRTLTNIRQIKSTHIRKAHGDIDTSAPPWTIRRAAPQLITTKAPQQTQAVWRCPVKGCHAHIPRVDEEIEKRERVVNLREQHRRKAHPTILPRSFATMTGMLGRTMATMKRRNDNSKAATVSRFLREDHKGHDIQGIAIPKPRHATETMSISTVFACRQCGRNFPCLSYLRKTTTRCGDLVRSDGGSFMARLRRDETYIGKYPCASNSTTELQAMFVTAKHMAQKVEDTRTVASAMPRAMRNTMTEAGVKFTRAESAQ